MLDALIPVLGGSAVMAFIAGLIALSVYLHKRNIARWQAMADELGLTMTDGTFFKRPEISGNYRGHPVRVYTYTQGSGKNRHTYTCTAVMFNQPLRLGLRVYKEGFFSKIGKAVGTQDIQTGDAAFDDRVMIKGDDEDGVLQVLTPEVRRAVGGMVEQEPGIQLDDSGMKQTNSGFVSDTARLTSLLDGMTDVCIRIEGGDGAPAQPKQAPVQDGFRVMDLPDGGGDNW